MVVVKMPIYPLEPLSKKEIRDDKVYELIRTTMGLVRGTKGRRVADAEIMYKAAAFIETLRRDLLENKK